MAAQEIWIERMTSPQVKQAIEQGYSTVLVAVGSNEQHGPHLPTGTDSLIGDKLVDETARRVGNVLVAPSIRVGASEHHMAYSGTITLREEVLEEIIVDYCRSLARHGFKAIIVIPTHGGNIETVVRTTDRLKRESLSANAVTLSDESPYLSAMIEVSSKLGITPGEAGTHAGHLETSIVLDVHPDIVDMDKATRGLVDIGYDTSAKLHEVGMHQLSPTGILGDATKSTAEAGKDYIEFMAAAMAEQVKKIRDELG
jgi:creatinine amidohydrolase